MLSKGKHKKRVKRTRAAACGDKTKYPAQAAAEQTGQNYIGNHGTSPEAVRAYRCPYCKHYHVGHIFRPDRRETQNRARHWK